mmetsp:Transcript_32277/g.77350  ORF Transcript_32277/g.77350 Transcript_32277/m.77350 type:complete len:202 (-) Transcript_32277:357-962(-)
MHSGRAAAHIALCNAAPKMHRKVSVGMLIAARATAEKGKQAVKATNSPSTLRRGGATIPTAQPWEFTRPPSDPASPRASMRTKERSAVILATTPCVCVFRNKSGLMPPKGEEITSAEDPQRRTTRSRLCKASRDLAVSGRKSRYLSGIFNNTRPKSPKLGGPVGGVWDQDAGSLRYPQYHPREANDAKAFSEASHGKHAAA